MRLPRQPFPKTAAPIQPPLHLPRPYLPVLVPAPNQSDGRIRHQTQRGRRALRLKKRRRSLISSQIRPLARLENVFEAPEPQPVLRSRPQLPIGGGDCPEERSDLRLPQRMRPQLQGRRTAGMHGGADGELEDAAAAAAGDEFGERSAVVVGGGGGIGGVEERACDRHGMRGGGGKIVFFLFFRGGIEVAVEEFLLVALVHGRQEEDSNLYVVRFSNRKKRVFSFFVSL